MDNTQIVIATFLFLSIFFLSFLKNYFSHNNHKSSVLPINLPIFGTIPSILLNLHHILDYSAEVLQQSQGTFLAKGPWFSKIEILITADPTNVHHIMCKRYEDFNRGANFNQIFEVLGEGILNSDFDKWKYQRKIAMSTFTSTRFREFMIKTLQLKLENGLTPLLNRSCKDGVVVDLQDIFYRLGADISVMLLIGQGTNFLSLGPSDQSLDLLSLSHAAEDAVLARHVLPDRVWKLQKRLRIGKERKHREFTEVVDGLIYESIRRKREEAMKRTKDIQQTKEIDLISLYMEEEYGADPSHGFESTDVFLRDTFVNLLLAGKDTVSAVLSWFFWLLTKHPLVEAKIKKELMTERNCTDISQLNNSDKFVYLHAAICETIRLYPPTPFVHRAANQNETLPSGHQVKPWTIIILSAYGMGRMKWLWGEDCEEFKPERWITEEGTIKHEPSHKFFAFNTGPRMCIGKDIALMQIKAIAREVLLQDYRFEVIQGHQVEPDASVLLRMKHGLKVKVMK